MRPTIKEFKFWSSDKVKAVCIIHGLYTKGTNEDYEHMLSWVDRFYPNTENIYSIAEDIAAHSSDRPLASIMYALANEAVTTTYEIDENLHGNGRTTTIF